MQFQLLHNNTDYESFWLDADFLENKTAEDGMIKPIM